MFHLQSLIKLSQGILTILGTLFLNKYRMLEDKYTEIERSNHRLFEKLSKLLDKSNKSKFLPTPIYK